MANGDRDPSSVLARLKRGLFMTHTELLAKVGGAIRATFEADPAALDALEEGLLAADVGPATAAGPASLGPSAWRWGRRCVLPAAAPSRPRRWSSSRCGPPG